MDMLLMCYVAPSKQSEIQRFVSQFLLIRDPKREISKIHLLLIRSRVICQVSALLNCRMGMSSLHACKGHEPFLEYPNELFSS